MSFPLLRRNAQAYSSQQLAYILGTMEQFITGKSVKGMSSLQPTDTQLLLLVSHDTNILYLQRLLDLNWIPMGYSNRIATTGGTLSFELWQDEDDEKEFYVKVHYDAARPDQQRAAEVLSLDNPPAVADVCLLLPYPPRSSSSLCSLLVLTSLCSRQLIIPECDAMYCPFEIFKSIVLNVIDSQCIEEPFKSSIQAMAKGSSDDNKDQWKDWELVVLTAGVCLAVFALVTVLFFQFFGTKSSSENPLLQADHK
jgi:hypothetical protein